MPSDRRFIGQKKIDVSPQYVVIGELREEQNWPPRKFFVVIDGVSSGKEAREKLTEVLRRRGFESDAKKWHIISHSPQCLYAIGGGGDVLIF